MNGLRSLIACLALLGTGQLAHAQMTAAEARAEGEAIGEGVRDATNSSILANGAESDVPTYAGTSFPALDYDDDPVGLSTAGEAARYQQDYQVVVDPYRTVFDPATIDLSSAKLIEGDPDTYLGPGVAPDGSTGACNPLPPGGGGTTTYLESCNSGSSVIETPKTCSIRMVPETTTVTVDAYKYWVVPNGSYGTPLARYASIEPYMTSGVCKPTGVVVQTCTAYLSYGWPKNKFCDDYNATEYVCSADLAIAAIESPITGESWHARTTTTSTSVETRRVDQCNALDTNAACTATSGEVCVEPGGTRIIDGVSVTEACWAWEKSFTCQEAVPANDCSDLDARAECSFDHDECLSDDANGACSVYDRWYRCTVPVSGAPPPPAYVCADDLYCIDGECTSIDREASTEFKDAMVAMNVMGELRDGFDPNELKIFSGENLKCTKKLFGLSNCCSGKGVPLLTPWLCNSEDREVDKKDDAGLCHYVGTYCSNKILGVCTTKKQSYCCYGSKLVRILNEQGKAQLGMQWGTPKDPDCEGFLIAQFQQLDLSRMDFSEVYAEFVDAAKLPDEIEMSIQIQQKIESYYNLNGGI